MHAHCVSGICFSEVKIHNVISRDEVLAPKEDHAQRPEIKQW